MPPVRIAISCSISLRRSPKPGALTATQVKVPRSLLTTSVDSASPSTSSAMMSSFLPHLHHLLQQGQDFLNDGNLLVGDQDIADHQEPLPSFRCRSPCRRKHSRGRTACPSTMVMPVVMVLLSSTVITPSAPTVSIASEISLPMVSSASGDRGDVGDRLLAVDGLGHAPSSLPRRHPSRPCNALLQHHGICAGGDVASDLRG